MRTVTHVSEDCHLCPETKHPLGEGGRRPGEGSAALGDPTLGGKRLLATNSLPTGPILPKSQVLWKRIFAAQPRVMRSTCEDLKRRPFGGDGNFRKLERRLSIG